jgi:hypothetical protein
VDSLTNHSDAVWTFVGQGPLSLQSDPKSGTFRETVTDGGLTTSAFMAPGDTMRFQGSLGWNLDGKLTATWLAQSVYDAAFKKLATSAATELLAPNSKSRAAVIQCGVSYYGTLTNQGVSGASTEETVLQNLDLTSTVGSCAKAWSLASDEIGSGESSDMIGFVEHAGTASDTVAKFDTGFHWISSFCEATHKC